MDKSGGAKGGRSKDGTAIALVKVGAHTGHIAYIIAYVIGDGCGIARVVFGDTGFHFTHEVGSYVGGFRIDTAAHACKQGLCGSSHTERQHRGGDDAKFMGGCHHIHRDNCVEQQIPERNVEQAEPHYNQSHYRAAAESDTQTRVQRVARGIRRTRRSIRSRLHSEKSGKTGEESACKESYRNPRVLHSEAVSHNREENHQPQEHPAHNLILLTEIGHGAFAHGSGNLNHLRSSLTLFHHLTVEIPGKAKCQNGSGWNQPEKQLVHSINRIKRLNESLKVLIWNEISKRLTEFMPGRERFILSLQPYRRQLPSAYCRCRLPFRNQGQRQSQR